MATTVLNIGDRLTVPMSEMCFTVSGAHTVNGAIRKGENFHRLCAGDYIEPIDSAILVREIEPLKIIGCPACSE